MGLVTVSDAPARAQRRRALLVLGMHRSGTSVLTRVISLLGADLPRELLPPGPDNPTGFWEGYKFVTFDDDVLAAAGVRWSDPWRLPEGFFASPARAEFARRLRDLVAAEFGASSLFVVKEPRICRLLPLWLGALAEEGYDVSAVLAIRDPGEVAASLHRRNGLPVESGLLLWLRYVLEAELGSRGLRRTVVAYDELLTDWRSVLRRVTTDLDLKWPDWTPGREAKIDGLLAAGRDRGRSKRLGPPTVLRSEWIEPVYAALRDPQLPTAVFDQIRAELDRSETVYGSAARLSANWALPELGELARGLRRAGREVNSLRERAAREVARLRERAARLSQQAANAEAYAAEVQVRHDELLASTSWRVTAPLRRLADWRAGPSGAPQGLAPALLRQMELISRSGLWHPEFYVATYPDAADAVDPLRHYVETGQWRGYKPNAWFDPDYYMAANPRALPEGESPLIDYIKVGAWDGPDPDPRFDARQYIEEHPQLQARFMTPLAHFLRFELPVTAEGPEPEPAPLFPAIHALAPLDPRQGWMWQRMVESGALIPARHSAFDPAQERFGTLGRTKLLFASHEFSRTGAPLILLKLLRLFAEKIDAELFVFCDTDGDLLDEFADVAHVLLGDMYLPFAAGAGIADLPTLLAKLAAPAPALAICNTANTTHYAREFRNAEIPVLTLVHEAAAPYDRSQIEAVFETASAVVFPSRFVQDSARAKVGDMAESAVILPQGLLRPELLDGDREAAGRAIRTELGLPPEALIAFTCGSMDLRKGADLFAAVAIAALRRGAPEMLHFVWLGGGDVNRALPAWWARYDIEQAGFGGRVRFLTPRADPDPWFLGSDLFILTSREDPLPCVVHEAMAAGMPVAAFEGGGGAPEQVGDTGVIVPYADIAAMAKAVLALAADDARRSALGAAARQRVRERYDFDDYFREIVGLAAAIGVPLPPA